MLSVERGIGGDRASNGLGFYVGEGKDVLPGVCTKKRSVTCAPSSVQENILLAVRMRVKTVGFLKKKALARVFVDTVGLCSGVFVVRTHDGNW